MFQVAERRSLSWVDSLDSHDSHQPLRVLSIHRLAQKTLQPSRHLTRTEKRRLEVLFVDQSHHLKILRGLRRQFVVVR